LQGTEKYCPACGQKAATHRFTWSHFFHESWHAVTHTDKGILNLLRGLATNPGRVVSEYVEGKHKKYFNPVTFLLLCLGLFVFINSYLKTFVEVPGPDPAVLAQLKTERQKKMYVAQMERIAVANKFREKHPNILAMVGFPLEALVLWLFFRKRGRNYVELLIAVIFLGGFANLLFTVVGSPLLASTKGTSLYFIFTLLTMLMMSLYVAWGLKGFLSKERPISYWKPLLVNILYYVIWTALVTFFFLWYVMRSNFGIAIKKLVSELNK